MPDLPTGTVTFLFTDIEGSTRLLKRLGDRYVQALADYERLLRAAFEGAGGHEIDTQGDAFFVAFRRAKDALAGATAAQNALANHAWPEGDPVRVRMGIHTAEPTVGGERYVGLGVHRAARVCAAGHGGQVLVSAATRELVEEELPDGVGLRDLGEHRLKDLDRPEHIFQLVGDGLAADFPPLKTLAAQPEAATPFAGRERELATAAQEAVGPPLGRRRAALLVLAAAALAAVAAAAVVVFTGGSDDALASVPPDSVGVIDPDANEITAAIPVGDSPGAISVGSNKVWVVNHNDYTFSSIDPRTRAVHTEGFSAGRTGPVGFVADPGGGVWISDVAKGTVTYYGAGLATGLKVAEGSNAFLAAKAIAVGAGSLWAVNEGPPALVRVDLTDIALEIAERIPLEHVPTALAVGGGFIWIGARDGTVTRLDPVTGELRSASVDASVRAIAVGAGAVWLTTDRNEVIRLDDGSLTVVRSGPLDGRVTAIAVGAGAVWVVNEGARNVTRIDPATDRVVETIAVGNRPQGVAVASGLVWVSVRR